MSTLLEQAIVDAEALKEAALKNAEQAIVEKYSAEVKTVVTQLLEQPMPEEDPMGMDMGMDMEEEGEESSLVDDVPPAYGEGEEICACPDDGQDLEFDLNDLRAEMEKDEMEADDMLSREDELGGIPTEEDDLAAPLEETVEIDDELLEEIAEALHVDIDPQKSGWAGTPASEMKEYENMLLAKERDSEVAEENEELRKTVEELQESNKSLKKNNKRYKEKLVQFKDRLNESNVSNAKLLYTNRVLSGTSLNERQKKNIVEAISRADSVEEAKVIYETLLSTVGNTTKKTPKSLSEAANRNQGSSLILSRNGTEQQPVDTTSERWKRLAGITTTN